MIRSFIIVPNWAVYDQSMAKDKKDVGAAQWGLGRCTFESERDLFIVCLSCDRNIIV